MMIAIHRLIRAARLVLSLALLVACGSSGGGQAAAPAPAPSAAANPQPTTTPAPVAAASPGCALLPPSEAAAAIGIDKLEAPQATVSGIVTLCQYSDGKNGNRLMVRFQAPTSASEFKMGKDGFVEHGQPVSELNGLGDAAYTSSVGTGEYQAHSVSFLSKNVEVLLTSSDSLEKLEALARKLITKL